MGSLKECGEQGERDAGVGGHVNSCEEGMPVAGGMSVAGGTCQKLSGAGGYVSSNGGMSVSSCEGLPPTLNTRNLKQPHCLLSLGTSTEERQAHVTSRVKSETLDSRGSPVWHPWLSLDPH